MTKEQAEVYQLLTDVACKAACTFVALGIYVAVAISLINHPNWPLAAFETLLSIGVGTVYFHYFPGKKDEVKALPSTVTKEPKALESD